MPLSDHEHSHKKSKKKKEKKSKKKHIRERDVSSGNSGESTDEFEEEYRDAQKRQDQRDAIREQKKLNKERMKLNETPEEKRARRIEKQFRKEQKKKNELGWGEECIGYSNVDNPFNDTKLTETFVWGKKLQKDGVTKIDVDQLKQQTRQRIVENKAELEYFKKAREEREREKEDRELMARENEQAQYSEWSRQEDKFHLTQAKLRSDIRVREKRAKVIDVLAKYISAPEGVEHDLEPYKHIEGLGRRDLEDLAADIIVYRNLETLAAAEKTESVDVADFWKDMAACVQAALDDFQQEAPDRRDGVHKSVKTDVEKIFLNKSHGQLALLETQMTQKIAERGVGVDVGYWESLLAQLTTHMARARLDQRHQHMLKTRRDEFKRAHGPPVVFAVPETPAVKLDHHDDDDEIDDDVEEVAPKEEMPKPTPEPSTDWSNLDAGERADRCMETYSSGRYSPEYWTKELLPPQVLVVDEEIDRVTRERSGEESSADLSAMEAKAREGMSKEESSFAVESALDNVSYLWSDKYKPRKPRYFNRVHTGFEWNKYNQTHYDLDNPPPKIVQGYRFNIFYPDLLDPTKAPKFEMYQCDDKDFAILRFVGGPPYEDLAFKIVNRDWEVLHKAGYRCQFQNGIFQLWFHFKRWRYRR